MTRHLTNEELDWLQADPLGNSHSITGGTNLAACDDCEWVAQADSFEYLMEQVGVHLKESFEVKSEPELESRRAAFIERFDWDPWAEGAVDDEVPHNVDIMMVTYFDEDEGGEIFEAEETYLIEPPDEE